MEGDPNGATHLGPRTGVHTFASPRGWQGIWWLDRGPYAEWKDTYRDDNGEIPLGIYCGPRWAQHMRRASVHPNQKNQGFGFYQERWPAYAFGQLRPRFVQTSMPGANGERRGVTFLED